MSLKILYHNCYTRCRLSPLGLESMIVFLCCVTHGHKLSSLKQHKLIITVSVGQESRYRLGFSVKGLLMIVMSCPDLHSELTIGSLFFLLLLACG